MQPKQKGAFLLALGVAACALLAGACYLASSAGSFNTSALDASQPAEDMVMNVKTLAKQRLAPEIQSDQWLNGEPVTLQALRGRVVLIDFWTFD